MRNITYSILILILNLYCSSSFINVDLLGAFNTALSPFTMKIFNKKSQTITNNNNNYNFINLVSKWGYTAEEYYIQSLDGYNLCLHRISGSPSHPKAPGKKVVYMQHGLVSWTVNYVLRGPGRDLAFLLADAGYDVWMGNLRGTPPSKTHKSKSSANKDFWDFSYHQMAIYDLSAFIDATLQITQQNKLVFYGYSLGTTLGNVLFSLVPGYNNKISIFIQVAPIVYWRYNVNPGTLTLNNLFSTIEYYNKAFGLNELFSRKKESLGKCNFEYPHDQITCPILFSFLIPTTDFNRIDKSAFTSFMNTWPVGSSARSFFHLAQNRRSNDFEQYDYGTRVNKIYYGSERPPKYPLHQISTPVAIFYGPNDMFTTDGDTETLRRALPNVIYVKKVPNNNFSHLDFILAEDAKSLVYDDVLGLAGYYSQF